MKKALVFALLVVASVTSLEPQFAHAATTSDSWKKEVCGTNPSSECVAVNFDTLVADAHGGSKYATDALFGALSKCEHAPRSQSEIESAKVTSSASDQQAATSRGRSAINSVFVACQYFTPAQMRLLPQYAWAASRLGNASAQSLLYGKLVKHDPAYTSGVSAGSPESLITDMTSTAKTGNGVALLLMSEAYRRGDLVPVDNVKAYAYYLAWSQKAQAPGATAVPARLQGKLSSDQISDAQKIAGSLVANNQP
jgi:hypothetical protein